MLFFHTKIMSAKKGDAIELINFPAESCHNNTMDVL